MNKKIVKWILSILLGIAVIWNIINIIHWQSTKEARNATFNCTIADEIDYAPENLEGKTIEMLYPHSGDAKTDVYISMLNDNLNINSPTPIDPSSSNKVFRKHPDGLPITLHFDGNNKAHEMGGINLFNYTGDSKSSFKANGEIVYKKIAKNVARISFLEKEMDSHSNNAVCYLIFNSHSSAYGINVNPVAWYELLKSGNVDHMMNKDYLLYIAQYSVSFIDCWKITIE